MGSSDNDDIDNKPRDEEIGKEWEKADLNRTIDG